MSSDLLSSTKFEKLEIMAEEEKLDIIIVITESWSNSQIEDRQIVLLLLSYARSILYAKHPYPQLLFHYSIILSPLFFTNVSAPICFELRTHLPVE